MASDSGSEPGSRSESPPASPAHNRSNNHSSDRNISIRFLVNSKEAGGIIGKGGANVKRYREESGARINISDGTASERIVVVSGTPSQIIKAFSLIGDRFHEDSGSNGRDDDSVTFKLVLPNTNCGSLIGKRGANIQELRELTGASIQVANEMLPNSTERNVTLAGSLDSVIQALDKICVITVETKPKGPMIPYQPGRGGYAASQSLGFNNSVGFGESLRSGMYGGGQQSSYRAYNPGTGGSRNQYGANNDMYSSSRSPYNSGYTEQLLRPGLLGNPSAQGPGGARVITKELTISSDSVGSIIGRQGTRINDIRESTGAGVRIADGETDEDRKVIITGAAPNVRAASYIIKSICNTPRNKSAQQE